MVRHHLESPLMRRDAIVPVLSDNEGNVVCPGQNCGSVHCHNDPGDIITCDCGTIMRIVYPEPRPRF